MDHRETRPQLRPIQVERVDHHGPAFLLRDPLQLGAGYLLVPQAYGSILAALDGQATYAELHAALTRQLGAMSGPALLDDLLQALDQAYLLENETFQAAHAAAVVAYRDAPYRPLSVTEAAPAAFRTALDGYLQAANQQETKQNYRGIFSPHIDYARGSSVYAQIWKHTAEAVRQAELVIVLATDHYSPEAITLTHQRYATPYGTLETDKTLVSTLAEAVGPTAFAAELYHRREHSVELVANWLHHMRAGKSCIMIPVLCGSFRNYTHHPIDPLSDPRLRGLVEVLQHIHRQRNALLVVSGDLSHVGPAFGDAALNSAAEDALRTADERLLADLHTGDPERFLSSVRAIRDRNKVCGLPPGYLALRTLGSTHGEQCGYLRCPADQTNTSAVTITGFAFA